MKTRKTLIGILIFIFLVTIGAIAFQLQNKKNSESAPVLQTSSGQGEAPVENKQQPQTVSLIEITGTISTIKDNMIVFQNGDAKNELSLIENPTIIERQNDKVVDKKPEDINENTKVKISVRQSDSKVVAIEILTK